MSHTIPSVEDTDEFVGTCDMGWCDRPTVALVLTYDGWRSSCAICALPALTGGSPAETIKPTSQKGDSRTHEDVGESGL